MFMTHSILYAYFQQLIISRQQTERYTFRVVAMYLFYNIKHGLKESLIFIENYFTTKLQNLPLVLLPTQNLQVRKFLYFYGRKLTHSKL